MNTLYIEIHEQKLLLAHLHNNKINSHKVIQIPPQNIAQGIIFNPKNVLTHIKTFMDANKLNKPWAVINVPELCNKEGILQTLSIFQFALILSKAYIKIQKIIASPQFENEATQPNHINNIPAILNNTQHINLLQQIQSQAPHNPLIWLGTTTICLACVIFIFSSISSKMLHKLGELQQSQQHLQNCINQMRPKTKDLANLKKQNESLNIKINKSRKYLSKNKNPLDFLKSVATKIPKNVWLTKIELGQAPKMLDAHARQKKVKTSNEQFYELELVGYSKQINSPLQFLERLSSEDAKQFGELKLSYLKKLDISDKFYEFKICSK